MSDSPHAPRRSRLRTAALALLLAARAALANPALVLSPAVSSLGPVGVAVAATLAALALWKTRHAHDSARQARGGSAPTTGTAGQRAAQPAAAAASTSLAAASSPTQPANPFQATASTDAMHPAPTPQPTPTSAQQCSYPPGYPRVRPPAHLGALGVSTMVDGLIIKEIASQADKPQPPHVARWLADASGTLFSVDAGPVLGAYMVRFAKPMPLGQAWKLVGRMLLADRTAKAGRPAQSGCIYDYIEPDRPIGVDTALSVGVAGPIIWPPESRTIPDLQGADNLAGFGKAWNTIVALKEQRRNLWPAAIAIIDPYFLARANPERTGIDYTRNIVRVTRDGTIRQTRCTGIADVPSGACHGEDMAALLAQKLMVLYPPQGATHAAGNPNAWYRPWLVGGSLGSNVYYRSNPDSVPQGMNSVAFETPLRRIQSGTDEFSFMAALAYAAGRPMYYRLVSATHKRLTDLRPPGRAAITSPRMPNRVVSMPSGFWVRPNPLAATPDCPDPLVADAVAVARARSTIIVAAAGNIPDRLRLPQPSETEFDGIGYDHLPSSCPGVISVGGYERGRLHGSPGYDLAFESAHPSGTRAILGPMLGIVYTNRPGSIRPSTHTLIGTSVATQTVAATVALMARIDPRLSARSAAATLRNTATYTQDLWHLPVLRPGEAVRATALQVPPNGP